MIDYQPLREKRGGSDRQGPSQVNPYLRDNQAPPEKVQVRPLSPRSELPCVTASTGSGGMPDWVLMCIKALARLSASRHALAVGTRIAGFVGAR